MEEPVVRPENQEIIAFLSQQRNLKQSYIKKLCEFMDVDYEDYVARLEVERLEREARIAAMPPLRRRRQTVSRETRLRDILQRRYNVPQALIEAYDDEVKDYDW